MNTERIIGQRSVIDRLLLLDSEGRVPHAMLFAGPQGVGKFAVAVEFAKHMLLKNDIHGNAESMIDRGSHPDLIYSFPVIRPKGTPTEHQMECADFMSEWHEMMQEEGLYFTPELWLKMQGTENQQASIGVGESNALIKKLSLKSSQGGYKVNIIWQADKMSAEAANKLLKIIEEPPTQTLFILTAEHPELILETIRSRTQLIEFHEINAEEIAQNLVEKRSLTPDIAMKVARAAHGSWLTALQIISGNGERKEFLEIFQLLMRLTFQKKVLELKEWCQSVNSWGREKQKRFLEYCLAMTRENFMYNFRNPELCYMTPREEAFASKFSPFINERNIIEFSELYTTAIRDISRNANGNIVLYDMAMRIIILLRK